VTHRRRWAAVALLNLEFALSYVAGGWLGLGYSITASLLTFFVSAAILRELYGGNEFSAFRHHLQLALGLIRSFQVIDGGKTVMPQGPGPLFGPRTLIIRPGNAVILERGSQQTDALGPRIHTSRPFEFVKQIYDLQDRQKSFTFEEVLTADTMPTTVRIAATFGLDVHPRAKCGERPLLPAEQALLQRISLCVTDWETRAKSALERCVRQSIGNLELTELLSIGDFAPLEQNIAAMVNATIGPWGVRVSQVILECVQPRAEVTEATASRWVAETQTDTTVTLETARAQALRDALRLIADGYRTAKAMGMSSREIHREVLRRTLEQIAKDPAAKLIFTPELRDLLRSLQ
jgi:regulator of protease activity HflC (stomatin/prohibitin superfamily)